MGNVELSPSPVDSRLSPHECELADEMNAHIGQAQLIEMRGDWVIKIPIQRTARGTKPRKPLFFINAASPSRGREKSSTPH